MSEKSDHHKFIEKKLKSGASAEDVVRVLTNAGWQHDTAMKAVAEVTSADTPPPPPTDVPAPPPVATNQTGGSGAPVQVENVQYNMGVSTVESRIGTFLKISAIGLWLTVIFVSWLLASVIGLVADDGGDFASQLVFTVALSAVSVPMFVIADKKVRAELDKNHALVDDLFFKKNVRSGLNASIGLTAISAFITLFVFLSAAFLADSDATALNGLQALMFTGGFGGALYYYWQLHSMTKR